MAVITNRFYYDAAPARVWAMVTDCGALAQVCARYLAFDGLPTGAIYQGQEIDVEVRLFGKLPPQPYHMKVESLDPVAMSFQSRETGVGVKRWDHFLQLHPENGGTVLHERIEIEAGVATPLFWLWGRFLYRGRHAPRVDLLAQGAF